MMVPITATTDSLFKLVAVLPRRKAPVTIKACKKCHRVKSSAEFFTDRSKTGRHDNRLAFGSPPTPAVADPVSKVGSLPFRFAVLLRSFGDLVLQVAGLMITAELAQRRLVQFKQNFAQLLGFGIAGCETLSVNLSQRADEGVSVFAADFAIIAAVAVVETCLAHAALHCARSRQHPLAGTYWQLGGFRNQARRRAA